MKPITKFISQLLCMLFILACQESKSTSQTKIFSKYLSYFKRELKNDYTYVLIPSNVCKGCSNNAANRIIQLTNQHHLNNVIFICANKLYAKDLYNKECIYDTLGKMEVMNLELGNLNIIHIKSNQIESNIEITNANLHLVDSLFSGKIKPSY